MFESTAQRTPFHSRTKLLLAALIAIATVAPLSAKEPTPLAKLFEARGLNGTIVVVDLATGRRTIHNPGRARQPFIPASTFKIPNSLIGLDAGVVRDVDELLPYGGKPQPYPYWEHDMALREAMKLSSVPIYQELARRIGPTRMSAGVRSFQYGNGEIGPVIDRFWLDGPLKISAVEQTEFLARLVQGTLPASPRAVEAVKEITLQEQAGDRALHFKTGFGHKQPPYIGWVVGWVKKGDRVSIFALNVDLPRLAEAEQRVLLLKECLAALELD